MGSMSIWHWIVVIAVVLLLFGRGKISELMGDVAQGIKSFKKGMSEDEPAKTETPPADPKVIDQKPSTGAPVSSTTPGAQGSAPGMAQHGQTERKFEGSTG
jgi:sec-independent protein translocase protein TatA